MQKYKVSIELTNVCNFNCVLCPQTYSGGMGESRNVYDRRKGFMEEDLFELCLQNSLTYADEVTFGFFGEQTLHPKFWDFIKMVPKNRQFKMILNTNFSLIEKEHFEDLKLFDSVLVSLDSHTPEGFEKVCPGVSYEWIADKIKSWLKYKGHSKTNIIHVLSSKNEWDRGGFLSTWKKHLSPNDNILMKSVVSYGGVMFDKYMSKAPCSIIKNNEKRIVIAWNGDCSPCNLDVNIELCIGNLGNDFVGFNQMIASESYKFIMQIIREKQRICINCFDSNNRGKRKVYKK